MKPEFKANYMNPEHIATLPGKEALPWIVAHRGAMAEFPENTRFAFDGALSYPISGIEFDVQLSRDEVPVIYHNKTVFKINRTRKMVASYLYEELTQLDWGGWFAKRFSGEPILTLEQMLRFYSGKTRLLIEIKAYEAEKNPDRVSLLVLHVLQQIATWVRPEDLKRCFILSFNREVLIQTHREAPHLNCVLNLEDPVSVVEAQGFKSDDLYGLCGPIRKLTPEFASFAHRKKLFVMTYSCINARQVKKAIRIGADVIMTDNPGWLSGHLKRE